MIKMVRFADVSLCTESFGSPGNPTLLLVMGAASSMIWWEEPFCHALAEKGFYVIRYDNRDTGKSTSYPPGAPGYTFEEMADDAMRLLDAYEIQKAYIMGMSMGGMLTQMSALRHPERVMGIVLLASMYFAAGAEQLPGMSGEVADYFRQNSSPDPEEAGALAEYAFGQWCATHKSSRVNDLAYIHDLIRLDVERAVNYHSRINHNHAQVIEDWLGKIAEIKAPTLVIHGDEDIVVPYPHGQMLAKTIPGAVLHTMKGAGHELNAQDFAPVADAITQRFQI